MPKKKAITKKTKKKITKKKSVLTKKTEPSKISKKSSAKTNSLELIFKENESQLISLITKEFDKELVSKAKTYIKSYSKIEESIITINDFLSSLVVFNNMCTTYKEWMIYDLLSLYQLNFLTEP